jgi:eukaryotic-like serine/threonine-protein kinase
MSSARHLAGNRVAVKELALGRLKSWKQLDMFEREAATLRGLSNPGIPKYVDYQQDDSCFFLVQVRFICCA